MAVGTSHLGGGLLLFRGGAGAIRLFCDVLALFTGEKVLVGSSKAYSMLLPSMGSMTPSVVSLSVDDTVVEGVFLSSESSGAKVAIFSSSPDSTRAISSVFTSSQV